MSNNEYRSFFTSLCVMVLPLASCIDERNNEVENEVKNHIAKLSSEDSYVNSIGMKFVRVSAGDFMVGARDPTLLGALTGSNRNVSGPSGFELLDSPQYKVTIQRDYYIGCFEVTVAQFEIFVSATGFITDAEKTTGGGFSPYNKSQQPGTWRQPKFDITPEHPVSQVSWQDAQAFCKWLSEKEGVLYRLPDESEWEYACRGGMSGSTEPFSFGHDENEINKHANIADKSLANWILSHGYDRVERCVGVDDGFAFTAPVGQFSPNSLGLYDMHGNIAEWCNGLHRPLDENGSPIGNIEPEHEGSHIVRGGSWISAAFYSTVTHRSFGHKSGPSSFRGFRLLRENPVKEQ